MNNEKEILLILLFMTLQLARGYSPEQQLSNVSHETQTRFPAYSLPLRTFFVWLNLELALLFCAS